MYNRYEWAKEVEEVEEVELNANILDYQFLAEKLYEYFIDHIYYTLTLIHDTKNLLTNSEKEEILLRYKTLTNQKCRFDGIRLNIPQPVTLTLNDINPYNPDSVLLKYAVTEKADGDRYILYILKCFLYPIAYYINNYTHTRKNNIYFSWPELP